MTSNNRKAAGPGFSTESQGLLHRQKPQRRLQSAAGLHTLMALKVKELYTDYPQRRFQSAAWLRRAPRKPSKSTGPPNVAEEYISSALVVRWVRCVSRRVTSGEVPTGTEVPGGGAKVAGRGEMGGKGGERGNYT